MRLTPCPACSSPLCFLYLENPSCRLGNLQLWFHRTQLPIRYNLSRLQELIRHVSFVICRYHTKLFNIFSRCTESFLTFFSPKNYLLAQKLFLTNSAAAKILLYFPWHFEFSISNISLRFFFNVSILCENISFISCIP